MVAQDEVLGKQKRKNPYLSAEGRRAVRDEAHTNIPKMKQECELSEGNFAIVLDRSQVICDTDSEMATFTTRQAAKELGLTAASLARYVAAKKVPAPKIIKVGNTIVHIWTAEDIERVRKLLPKIANGRKTRWQRQRAQQQMSKGKTKTPKKKK